MNEKSTATDPVCGMSVDTATAEYRSFRDGQAYYFCSSGCKESFDQDPGKFLGGAKTRHPNPSRELTTMVRRRQPAVG
jgi:Cu+-exporting ATPase